MERSSSLPERVHRAVARTRQAGASDKDIAEAVCAEVAAYLREDQAMWRAGQAGRKLDDGDSQFDSAVTQCADAIDPEVWRYLRLVP